MRIAITGGTGFVGGHLAARLRADGHETVILSRRTGASGSTSARTGWPTALEGCEAVVHCAGINREIGDQTYEAVHVRGTEAVIEAARAAGVEPDRHAQLPARPAGRPDELPPLEVGRRGTRPRLRPDATRSSRPASSTAAATTCSTT